MEIQLEHRIVDVVEGSSVKDNVEISKAISLKRIADSLEKLSAGANIEAIIDKIANHPTNGYGEGFSDAIQNAIVRGLQGIDTNGFRR